MSARRLAIALMIVSTLLIATSAAFIVDGSVAVEPSTHPWSEQPMHDYLFKETK